MSPIDLMDILCENYIVRHFHHVVRKGKRNGYIRDKG
jgi:hypothetical protein